MDTIRLDISHALREFIVSLPVSFIPYPDLIISDLLFLNSIGMHVT